MVAFTQGLESHARLPHSSIQSCQNPSRNKNMKLKIYTLWTEVGSTEYKSNAVLYRRSFSVPIPVPTELFKNGTEVLVSRCFFKKVFCIFSFLLLLID